MNNNLDVIASMNTHEDQKNSSRLTNPINRIKKEDKQKSPINEMTEPDE